MATVEASECDLDTMEPDGTWIRAIAGSRGVDVHRPSGAVDHYSPRRMRDVARGWVREAFELEDGDGPMPRWTFWLDVCDALGYLEPRGYYDAQGPALYRTFMARVDDVASDLSILLAQQVWLQPQQWLEARAILLYLRAEALCAEPRTFGLEEGGAFQP